jgi:hypothetical protein
MPESTIPLYTGTKNFAIGIKEKQVEGGFRMTIKNVVGALKFPRWYSQPRIAEQAASRTLSQSLPFRT